MNKETLFSEHEKAAITDFIQSYDHYRNAAIFGQVLSEIYKHFNKKPFVLVENILRSLGSDTYLVARHISEQAQQFISSTPGEDIKYQYYLYIYVNGKEEQQAALTEIGIDDQENLTRLAECGFLMMSQRPVVDEASNAHLN